MKKVSIAKILSILLVIFSITLCLVACNPDKPVGGNVTVLPDDSSSDTVKYSVTFKYDDGVTSDYVISGILANGKIVRDSAITDVNRNGYTFGGWFTSRELYTEWDFNVDVVTENTTLYAKWILKTPVFIDSDKFVFSNNKAEYTVASNVDTVNLSKSLVLEHYNYRYQFFADNKCTEPIGDIDEAQFSLTSGANNYYIKIMDNALNSIGVYKFIIYRTEVFTVKFYNTSNVLIEEKQVSANSTVSSAADFSVAGKEAIWTSASGVVWKFGNNGTRVTSNVELFVSLKAKTYTISLNADGGIVSSADKKVTYESSFTLPTPVKDGSNFIGWYTAGNVQITAANGISITPWNIAEDIELKAKWSNMQYTVTMDRLVNGEVVANENKGAVYGQSYGFTAYQYAIVNHDLYSELYAFEGWFDKKNGARLSRDRTFSIAEIVSDTAIEERWKILKINHNLNADDVELTISLNATYESNGNINYDETVRVNVACKCGEHTFNKWSNEVTTSFITLQKSDSPNAVWTKYYVKINKYLDGNPLDDNPSNILYSGDGAVGAGRTAMVNAVNNTDYTFGGWYGEDGVLLTETHDFDYSFTMPESDVTICGMWYTTESLINVNSFDTKYGSLIKRVNENIVGEQFRFDITVNAGYTFVGIYVDGHVINNESKIPAENTTYEVKFINSSLEVKSNIINGGQIQYKVNDSGYYVGTNYGGEVTLKGTSVGDKVTVMGKSNDGYVWLGWFDGKGGNLLTTDLEYTFNLGTVKQTAYAQWRVIAQNVKASAGVYSKIAVTTGARVAANKFYEYKDGKYTLTTDTVFVANKTYYLYASNVAATGTQKVTAELSSNANQSLTLTTTINPNYRFEGWFDGNGKWLSYDFCISVPTDNATTNYTARFTNIRENYDIKISVFEGNLEAGTVSVYAYKVGATQSEFTEYCKMTVSTAKKVFTGNYTGYNFFNLYDISAEENNNITTMDDLRTLPVATFENDNKTLSKDSFTEYYDINVTELKGQTKEYLAAWSYTEISGKKTYETAAIVNSNPSYGNVYYLARGGKIILVAEANNGFLFAGWQDEKDEIIYAEVYNTNSECTDKTFTAKWLPVNNSDRMYTVSTNLEGAGSYTMTGKEIGDTTTIKFTETTNNGYLFLGWYVDGELLTTANSFEISIINRTVNDESTIVKSLFIDDEEYTDIDYSHFELKWRKLNAEIVIESIGDASIRGYAVSEDDITEYYYRIRVESDSYFDDNGYAWYNGYYFDGWYDVNNDLISEELELVVKESELLSYYKAVWSEPDVTVNIDDTSGGDSYARYFIQKSGGTIIVTLQAFIASGYQFSGWYEINPETNARENLSVLKNYKRIVSAGTELSLEARFNALNGITIRTSLLNSIDSTVTSDDAGKPTYYSYKTGVTNNTFVLSANPNTGYHFVGWRKENETTIISTDMDYVISVTSFSDADGVYVAEYQPINCEDSFINFKLVTDYPNNVKYFAFNKKIGNEVETQKMLAISVDLPNGYVYHVYDGSGKVLSASEEDPYTCYTTEGNQTFRVVFEPYSVKLNNYIEFQEQVEQILVCITGQQKIIYDLCGKSYYFEYWTSVAEFNDKKYDFIGWYDSDGNLLSIEQTYNSEALCDNTERSARFGYYTVDFDNTNTDAGHLSANGYNITVSYDINNKYLNIAEIGGAVSSQTLNINDTLEYPDKYVNATITGYVFAGWYDNKACDGEPFDFTKPISKSIVLYAKWTVLQNYNATTNDVIKTDGTEITFNASPAPRNFYFTALTDGYYYLYAKNGMPGQTVVATVDGKEYEFTSLLYSYDGVAIQVTAGECYRISFKVKEANNVSVMIKIIGDVPSDGGARDNLLAYRQNFTVKAAENTGYTFEGWYINGTLISGRKVKTPDTSKPDINYSIYDLSVTISPKDFAKYADENGRIVLEAKWSKYEVELINTNIDAGVIEYTTTVLTTDENYGARAWILTAQATTNYKFTGWYLYDYSTHTDSLLSSAEQYTYIIVGSSITVLAYWEYIGSSTAKEYTITYSIGNGAINSPANIAKFYSTNTTDIVLYDPIRPYNDNGITGHYIFEGWYTKMEGDTYVNRITTIKPSSMTDGATITLYAKWGLPVCELEILEDNGVKYMYLGEYPQTLVTDKNIINNIDTKQSEDGYYHSNTLNGEKYALITLTESVSINGTVYAADKYYFRVEKIRWNVLTAGEDIALIESAYVIDSTFYNLSTGTRSVGGKTIYSNNWERSDIRNWLNNEFLSKCFNILEQNLIKMTVTDIYNTAEKGDRNVSDVNTYPWTEQNNTKDNLFIMSYSEKTDNSLGYKNSAILKDEARQAIATEYSVFSGVKGHYNETDGNTYAYYWLRSPANDGMYVYCVDANGAIVKCEKVSCTEIGVRPLMYINIQNK